ALIDARVSGDLRTWSFQKSERESYALRANRIAIRNPGNQPIAVVDLVSPGNKDSSHAIKAFVEKITEFLARGVNLLVIDLFPPTPRDPHGIHKVIWDKIHEAAFELPPETPLVLASYLAARPRKAYVETVRVGDPLPAMPIFFDRSTYILAPLEETYMRTWEKCPREMRELVENPPDTAS